nr:hypothetical protein CFP56_21196 [Quercus suber]
MPQARFCLNLTGSIGDSQQSAQQGRNESPCCSITSKGDPSDAIPASARNDAVVMVSLLRQLPSDANKTMQVEGYTKARCLANHPTPDRSASENPHV